MSEPWFLAPERCVERGARMQLLGHVGCRCNYCTFAFRSATSHIPPTEFQRACRHQESMWGRCADCGRTWRQQAQDRKAAPGGDAHA